MIQTESKHNTLLITLPYSYGFECLQNDVLFLKIITRYDIF